MTMDHTNPKADADLAARASAGRTETQGRGASTSLVVPDFPGYAYLDSGAGERLERFGPYVIRRPAPHAVWRPRLDAAQWDAADATYVRTGETGHWLPQTRVPAGGFAVSTCGFTATLRPSTSGQVGLFPEQAPNWAWVAHTLGAAPAGAEVLNLFAYTGAMTLAAARAGAAVCHVDAVRSVVDWARANAAQSDLDRAPIRWIVDDALQFVRREGRRGRRYEGIILDPPTFGHGGQGQVWRIDDHIGALVDACVALLGPAPRFVLLTCHTPGYVAATLANLLAPLVDARGGALMAGDLVVSGAGAAPPLPLGVYARWTPGGSGQAQSAGSVAEMVTGW